MLYGIKISMREEDLKNEEGAARRGAILVRLEGSALNEV